MGGLKGDKQEWTQLKEEAQEGTVGKRDARMDALKEEMQEWAH